MTSPDPRPAPRVRDPELMRILHANPHKSCEVTGYTDRVELHHVLARGAGRGDDVRENLVFLDAEFHAAVTRNQEWALRALGDYIKDERPDTIAYLYRKLGDGALDWMQRRLYIGEKP